MDDVAAVHRRLAELLAEHGARVDAVHVCPHEAGACDCRKLLPGLLLRAATGAGVAIADAVLVGDAATDVGAAGAAGCASIRLAARPDPDAESGQRRLSWWAASRLAASASGSGAADRYQ